MKMATETRYRNYVSHLYINVVITTMQQHHLK